jgi:hypothetical protein
MITLSLNDNVVLRLDNGNTQSALVHRFSVKQGEGGAHRYAHFRWKTGPKPTDIATLELHSAKWAERVLAVFPKGALFLNLPS